MRVSARNALFQQWQALLANRAKRHRLGEFLVHGVRPITMAVAHRWAVRALLYDDSASLSRWASDLLATTDATRVAVASHLLAELGAKDEGAPELIAVAAIPPDDLQRIPSGPEMLVVVLDRPTNPGNIGTIIRSADAFAATGVIVTGHAADVYDPKAVRASTGSVFAVPTVRVPSHQPVLDWVTRLRQEHPAIQIIATDEHGETDLAEIDLRAPTVLLVGNETVGLSAAWRAEADRIARIPISGAASSLNAAVAASISLYEVARHRRDPT